MPAVRRHQAFIDIAGVVPCEGGWLVLPGRVAGVTVSAENAFVVPKLRYVLEYRPSFSFAAYAVPFGFPDESVEPYRRCDRLAREVLGWPRSASLAPVPSRQALFADSFDDARRLEPWMRPTDRTRFARLHEVAAEIQPFHTRSNYSAHPELSFAQMNGDHGLVRSPWSEEGQTERLALVRAAMRGVDDVVGRTPPDGAEVKQMLDAAAMLWTARRASGRAIARLPVDPEWNGLGIRMEWVR